MFIKKKKGWQLPESEATKESTFRNRRRFIKALGLGTIAGGGLAYAGRSLTRARIDPMPIVNGAIKNEEFQDAGRPLTTEDSVYRFNNFYEFSIGKTAPAYRCRDFRLDPWTLTIDGQVNKPQTFDLEDIQKMQLEERVYRFRCVEAWSMTVPWLGVPLRQLIAMADPKSSARFVLISSFYKPDLVPRQRSDRYPWPYQEAITIREAMNPLAFAAIGLYGRLLQPQNGAPFRTVFPWKYGFKGPKSVVKISLTDYRPKSFWNTLQPHEYGFYGNVDPSLPHPRWSQSSEALIGTWGKRQKTQKYNGYQRWVDDMYVGNEY